MSSENGEIKQQASAVWSIASSL